MLSTLLGFIYYFKIHFLILLILLILKINNDYKQIGYLLLILAFFIQLIIVIKTPINNPISHAGSSVDGNNYYNIGINIDSDYAQGIRYYEYDFLLSSDNKIILGHELTQNIYPDFSQGVTKETFDAYLIDGTYPTMPLTELLSYLETYPDIYILVDTKEENTTLLYQTLINEVSAYNSVLLDRLIPQLYTFDMYQVLVALYSFPEYHFSTYKYLEDLKETIDFVNNNDKITGIAFSHKNLYYLFMITTLVDDTKSINAHTINNSFAAKLYQNSGVDLIFSDDIK
jgi:glycerophosphoryl diester phosphodiesterase